MSCNIDFFKLKNSTRDQYEFSIACQANRYFSAAVSRSRIIKIGSALIDTLRVHEHDDIYKRLQWVVTNKRAADGTTCEREKKIFFGGVPTSRLFNGLVKLAKAVNALDEYQQSHKARYKRKLCECLNLEGWDEVEMADKHRVIDAVDSFFHLDRADALRALFNSFYDFVNNQSQLNNVKISKWCLAAFGTEDMPSDTLGILRLAFLYDNVCCWCTRLNNVDCEIRFAEDVTTRITLNEHKNKLINWALVPSVFVDAYKEHTISRVLEDSDSGSDDDQ